MLTLLQSVKLLMFRYIVTPSALGLDVDDTGTDDAVPIYLFLVVLQYDLRSKSGTFTAIEFSIQVSLIAEYSDRLMIVSVEMSFKCVAKLCALMAIISMI